jgi:hypothetical protein
MREWGDEKKYGFFIDEIGYRQFINGFFFDCPYRAISVFSSLIG